MKNVEIILRATGGSPVVSIQQLADMLKVSVNSIHVSLNRDTSIGRGLKPYKRKIGRRIYFEVEGVAKLIEDAAA